MSEREYEELKNQQEQEWGPTEPDEIAVLEKLFTPEHIDGGADIAYTLSVGSLAPINASAVINYASQFIGVHRRPNRFTREYAGRHGAEFLTASWCDMFVTYVARHVPAAALLPEGDRAYTPWHAGDFRRAGRWVPGTRELIKNAAGIGDPVLFDWGQTNTAANVDHIGLTVKNLGDGRLVTIEGNTGSNEVRLRVRGADVIAGFAALPFDSPNPIKRSIEWPYGKRLMRRGWLNSSGVKKVQARLNMNGYRPALATDGDFGAKTERAVRWFQRKRGLQVDGVVGPKTWAKLFT